MRAKPEWIVPLMMTVLLVSACAAPGTVPRQAAETATIPPVASRTPPATATPEATTSTPNAEVNCGYTWAYNSDEKGAAKARHGLEAAGVKVDQANIQLFGEDARCSDGSSRFLLMESTLNIQLPVENMNDGAALGALLHKILAADSVLSVAKLVGLRLAAGDESASLRFPSERGQQLLAQGLDGADLWLALLSSLAQTGVSGIAFSPNDRWLLTSSPDGFLRVWDVKTGELSRVIFTGGGGGETAFTPDGERFFVASGDTLLYRFDDGRLVASLPPPAGEAHRLALSADGKYLVIAGKGSTADRSTLSVYAVTETGADLLYQPVPTALSLAVSPDAKHLAIDSGGGAVQVLELASGDLLLSLLRQLPTPESVCSVDYDSSLSFSPDGKALALSFCSEYINLLDVPSGDLRAVLQPGGLLVGKVAFSPDGRLLAVATHDGSELRNTDDWTVIARLKKPSACEVCNETVSTIAFSPDGSLLAAAVEGGIEIWRVGDGSLAVELGR